MNLATAFRAFLKLSFLPFLLRAFATISPRLGPIILQMAESLGTVFLQMSAGPFTTVDAGPLLTFSAIGSAPTVQIHPLDYSVF